MRARWTPVDRTILLILLDDVNLGRSGKGSGRWISPRIHREKYVFSDTMWRKGTAELTAYGLIEIERRGVSWEAPYSHNRYLVLRDQFEEDAATVVSEIAAKLEGAPQASCVHRGFELHVAKKH